MSPRLRFGSSLRHLGAQRGGFAHDTGEGSISQHHRVHGGDLVWEIGSGYFGCRNDDGTFNAEKFRESYAQLAAFLIDALDELRAAYEKYQHDAEFKNEFAFRSDYINIVFPILSLFKKTAIQ